MPGHVMPLATTRMYGIRTLRTPGSRLVPATGRLVAALVAAILIAISSGAIVGCGLIEMATGGPTESDTKKAQATALAVDAEATIAATSKLIEEEPADVDALLRRGNARLRLDRLEEALADYELAIAQDPKYAPAYNNRGVVFSRMGQPAEAASDYERAVDLDPNLAIPFYNRAVDLDNAVSLKLAISAYTIAIKRDPSLLSAYNNRGAMYIDQGRLNHALDDLTAPLSPTRALPAPITIAAPYTYVRASSTRPSMRSSKRSGLTPLYRSPTGTSDLSIGIWTTSKRPSTAWTWPSKSTRSLPKLSWTGESHTRS